MIPKPWLGVDPLANGLRFVVDAVSGGGGIDVTLPGGAPGSATAAARNGPTAIEPAPRAA